LLIIAIAAAFGQFITGVIIGGFIMFFGISQILNA
jgi:hypothetical protein